MADPRPSFVRPTVIAVALTMPLRLLVAAAILSGNEPLQQTLAEFSIFHMSDLFFTGALAYAVWEVHRG